MKEEDYYKYIFQVAEIGIANLSLEGQWLSINPKLEQMLGYSNQELQQLRFQDITHPDDIKQNNHMFREVIQQKKPHYEINKRFVKKDGSIFWASVNLSLVKDDNDFPIHCVSIIKDIQHEMLQSKHQRQQQKAITNSEAKLKEIQKLAFLGGWELDLVNNVLYCSDEVFDIFEIDKEKFQASHEAFMALVHPDDREAVNRAYSTSLENHLPYQIEYRLLMTDGRIKYVLEQCKSYFDQDGKPLRSIGTMQDVTRQKLYEQTIERQAKSFSSLVQSIPGITFLCPVDEQRNFSFVSKNIFQLTGFHAEDFIEYKKISFEELIHADDLALARQSIDIALSEGTSWNVEYRIKLGKHKICWIEERGSIITDELGVAVQLTGILFDITQAKSLELKQQKLSQYNQILSGATLYQDFSSGNQQQQLRSLLQILIDSIENAKASVWLYKQEKLDCIGHLSIYHFHDSLESIVLNENNEYFARLMLNRMMVMEDIQLNNTDNLQLRSDSLAVCDMAIMTEQGLFGILRIEKNQPYQWDDEDVSFIATFSSLISNLLLFHKNLAAKQRTEFIEQLINQSLEPVFALDIAHQYQFVYLNHAVETYFENTNEKIIHTNIKQWVPELSSERLRDINARLKNNNSSLVLETILCVNENKVTHIELSFSLVKLSDAEYLICSIRSIEERLAQSIKILENQQQLNNIFENTAFGIAMIDLNCQIIRVNSSFADTLKYPASDELIGLNIKNIFPNEGSEFIHYCEQLQQNNEFIREIPLLSYQNKQVWCRMHVRRMVGDFSEAQLENTLMVIENIEEKRLYESAIHAQELQIRAIFDNMPFFVWMKDSRGRYLLINQFMADELGVTIENTKGKTDLELWPSDMAEKYMAGDDKLIQTREQLFIEELFDMNGKERWEEMIKSPVLDDDEVIATVGICRDITERKEMEASLINYNTLLKDEQSKTKQLLEEVKLASQAKTNFMANMSHEIRTPLNGIMGVSQLLQHSSLDDKQKQLLETLELSAQNLLVLINDILDFSKISANKLKLNYEPYDIHKLIQSTQTLLNDLAEKKNIVFNCDCPKHLDLLELDPARVSQVLLNLINNAIKFTHQGSVDCRVSVVSESPQTITLLFEVEDTGIGIDAQYLDLIFEHFSQADGTISRKFGGSGLGLAISQNLIQMMGGKIRVDSRLGQGSRFYFQLECKLCGKAEQHEDKGASPVCIDNHEKAKVLLVEDEPVNQMVARKLLQKLNIKVDLAKNGEEAVKMATQHRYSLIFMDLQMPVMDGLTASKKIRAMGNETTIVALTANVMSEDKKACLDAGMNDYLSKPVNLAELDNMLKKWIKREG